VAPPISAGTFYAGGFSRRLYKRARVSVCAPAIARVARAFFAAWDAMNPDKESD
jgi:hypothetical protein